MSNNNYSYFWNLRNYRKNLIDLKDIIEAKFNEPKVSIDCSPLEKVINDLEDASIVEYKLQDLVIEFKQSIAGSNPPNMHFSKLLFRNTIKLSDNLDDNKDVLYKHKFEILLQLYSKEANHNKQIPYCSIWHLDKQTNLEQCHTTHPLYHFQFGGREFRPDADDRIGVFPAPRIPHPPMDIILGFHFIINNYMDKEIFKSINDILNDDKYKCIIKQAQSRLWEPYFKAYSIGDANTHQDFNMSKVFPLYIQ